MPDFKIKNALLAYCREYAENRIESIQQSLASAREAVENETKSSSGDKYETNRAMMHLEVEKLSEQLAAAQDMLKTIYVTPLATGSTIGLGSIVRTDNGNFFLAIGAGKTAVEGEDFFMVSPSAPVALAMTGKEAGESFEINSRSFTILRIE